MRFCARRCIVCSGCFPLAENSGHNSPEVDGYELMVDGLTRRTVRAKGTFTQWMSHNLANSMTFMLSTINHNPSTPMRAQYLVMPGSILSAQASIPPVRLLPPQTYGVPLKFIEYFATAARRSAPLREDNAVGRGANAKGAEASGTLDPVRAYRGTQTSRRSTTPDVDRRRQTKTARFASCSD